MEMSVTVHPCERKDKPVCSQVCNKKADKYECACEDDFQLLSDEKTCILSESFFLPCALGGRG